MNEGIIVCGFGHVGFRIVTLLARLGEKITVIYDNAPPEWIGQAEKSGVRCLKGSAASEALLEAAGVRGARSIIAATDSDTTNLSIVMDARRLNPGIIAVARIFDQTLAPHLESALAIRRVLSTSALASPVFTSAALGQDVCGFFMVDDMPRTLKTLQIGPGSSWLGMTPGKLAVAESITPLFILSGDTLSAADPTSPPLHEGDTLLILHDATNAAMAGKPDKQDTGPFTRLSRLILTTWAETSKSMKWVIMTLATLVVTGTFVFHYRLNLSFTDALYFVITTVTTTGYGDYNLSTASASLKLFGCVLMLSGAALLAAIFSVVTDLIMKARFRDVLNIPAMPRHQRVIIAGMQNIGTRIINELRQAGMDVVAIRDRHEDSTGGSPLKGVPVITGDPRSEETLTRAGIDKATAVIAVTDDDIINLGTGLQAKRMNPNTRTVIRTFDALLGSKLQAHLGVDSVISTSAVSAPMFAGTSICRDVIHGMIWQDHLILVQSGTGVTAAQPDRPATATIALPTSKSGTTLTVRALPLTH